MQDVAVASGVPLPLSPLSQGAQHTLSDARPSPSEEITSVLSEIDEDEDSELDFLETDLSEIDEEEDLQVQDSGTVLSEVYEEEEMPAQQQIFAPVSPPPPPPKPVEIDEEAELHEQQQPVTPPPRPVLSDNIVEEELQLHHNVTPPPPPPPPPRDMSKVESNYHELSAMMETVSPSELSEEPTLEGEMIPSPESLDRTPFSSLASQQQQQPQPNESSFPHEEKKESESLGEIPMVKTSSNVMPGTKPPKQPMSNSADYGSRLESFQMAMFENIEKEANMIRRSGSFQYHQNNLSHQKEGRKQIEPESSRNNENISETPRQKGNRPGSSNNNVIGEVVNDTDVGTLLKETMNDISSVAASGLESLKNALQQHRKDQFSENKGFKIGTTVLPVPAACGKIDDSATAFGMEDDDHSNLFDSNADPKTNHAGADLVQKMQKMHDGLRKMMVGAANAAKNAQGNNETTKGGQKDNSAEAWGVGNLLANGFRFEGDDQSEDGMASQATYDTWDDENSVLRRLGSWGTVNSQFTAGTTGTAGTYATYDESISGSVSAAVAQANTAKARLIGPDGLPQEKEIPPPGGPLRDDDGNIIDPSLAALSKKKQKRKTRRRKKKVKWDYPHISSLRQYEPPAKEDLPNLFFTEAELDQIEDDRYSTMCSDDIEIVAVASAEDDSPEAKVAAKKKKKAEKEKGFKSTKGRSSTPNRHRTSGEMSPKNKESRSDNGDYGDEYEEERSSPRRLVKGVQIYLRERSTGT